MMDHHRLDADLLGKLADFHGDRPHISLYSPMIKAGPETRQNPIRFKNLLREARTALEAGNSSSADIAALLEPLEARIEDYEFWQHQEAGLAVFVAENCSESFRLPLELPALCVVTNRFHLKPLFPLLSGDGRYYVLALSQNAVRLFECSRYAVREIALGEDVPRSLSDALGHELTERQLQFRSPRAGEAIFHAHGAGKDDVKPEIRKFLALVDEGVGARIGSAGGTASPLVLAAVEELAAMYRAVSDRDIVDAVIAGNPEHRSAEELNDAAWPLVEPGFDNRRQRAIERYSQAKSGGTASADTREIVIAAEEGRVELLLVAQGLRRWGRVNPAERQIELHKEQMPGSEDVLDRAAVAALRNGGEVFVVAPQEVPEESPIAAVYRY